MGLELSGANSAGTGFAHCCDWLALVAAGGVLADAAE